MIFSKALIEFVHPKYVGKCHGHIAKEFNLSVCPVLECYKDVGSLSKIFAIFLLLLFLVK